MLKILQAVKEIQGAIDRIPVDRQKELAVTLVGLSKKLLDDIIDIGNISEHYHQQLLPAIEAQLQAADKRTEKAADTFLSSAEKIGALAAKAEGSLRDELQDQVNAIFEAASFQDLVSQHLNEVKLRLHELNRHMHALQAVFNDDREEMEKNKKHLNEHTGIDSLLHGPSTEV